MMYAALIPVWRHWKVADNVQFVGMISSSSENGGNMSPIALKAKLKVMPRSASSAKAKAPNAEPEPESPTKSPASGSASSDINTLPEFAQSAWSTRFLPTLYDYLGCATDPFVLNADMVSVMQEIHDRAYPTSNHQVRATDRIYALVFIAVLRRFQD